jgi:hypothetical protein
MAIILISYSLFFTFKTLLKLTKLFCVLNVTNLTKANSIKRSQASVERKNNKLAIESKENLGRKEMTDEKEMLKESSNDVAIEKNGVCSNNRKFFIFS